MDSAPPYPSEAEQAPGVPAPVPCPMHHFLTSEHQLHSQYHGFLSNAQREKYHRVVHPLERDDGLGEAMGNVDKSGRCDGHLTLT
jgi:hypothetical protein